MVGRLAPRWRLSPCYMHSLGITDNYLVLLEMPLAVSVSDVMSDVFNASSLIDGMKWHEDNVSSVVMYGGFQGGPQLGPHDVERRQSLGQL